MSLHTVHSTESHKVVLDCYCHIGCLCKTYYFSDVLNKNFFNYATKRELTICRSVKPDHFDDKLKRKCVDFNSKELVGFSFLYFSLSSLNSP